MCFSSYTSSVRFRFTDKKSPVSLKSSETLPQLSSTSSSHPEGIAQRRIISILSSSLSEHERSLDNEKVFISSSLVQLSSPLLHSCLLSFATPSNKFRHIDSAALFSLSTSAAATDRTESERREQGRSMSRVERERRRPPRPPSQPLALSLSQPAFLSFSSSGGSWRRREIKTQRRRRPTKALWTG